MGVIAPLAAVSVGVDGSDIFQILAVDNLELDPRAIGIALGLGTLSIPLQIWAARIPLHRARHNIRIFLFSMGIMAITTGALVAFAPPASPMAGVVLVIAVVAEIAVSVLLATAWQPVISYVLSQRQRQLINAQGRATTGTVLFVSVLLFGYLDQTGRALFLVAVGLAAMTMSWLLRVLPPPRDRPIGDLTGEPAISQQGSGDGPDEAAASTGSAALSDLYLVLSASALTSWPLLIAYARFVQWPTGNLGILGAAFALGSIIASASWRDPGHRLVTVIRVGAIVVAICSVGIVAIGGPIESTTAGVILLAVVTIGAAARSTMRVGIMELAHRRITAANSVRVMTLFDVVGSTTFQLGFFVAGFLISASTGSTAAVDAYQLWLLLTAVYLMVAVFRLRPRDRATASQSAGTVPTG